MPHHITNRLDTDAASEQAHRKRVSKLIHVDRRRKARLASSLLEDLLHSGALDRAARAARTQEELRVRSPLLVTAVDQVLSQQAERRGGERKLQVDRVLRWCTWSTPAAQSMESRRRGATSEGRRP